MAGIRRYVIDLLICQAQGMASRGEREIERLKQETDRLLNESRKDIELMNLSIDEARRNIRDFLASLPQFNHPKTEAECER